MVLQDADASDRLAAEIRRLTSSEPAVRAQACRAVAAQAARGEHARTAIIEAAAVQSILPLLHAAPTQAEAAQALAALAVDDEARRLILAGGGCEPLVRGLHSKSVQAQEHAAVALSCIAQDEAGRAQIAELGGVLALVGLVQSNERQLQLPAARALCLLALDAENRINIVAADGHDAMIELLRGGETPAPAELQALAAETLASLALYTHNRRKVREAGGVERLVDALASDSGDVQAAATTALARLANHDGECQEAIRAAGGVRELSQVLWSDDAESRQFARAALESLGADADAEKEAWAQAVQEKQAGQFKESEELREKADASLLRGDLGAAAATYASALELHPHSTVLQQRLERTRRESTSASASIEQLAGRAASVRLTRRKLSSKAPDPLQLEGMPDGVLSLVDIFRAVDSRRKRGDAAHTLPSFTSARQQLEEASAQLDARQSALYRRAMDAAPTRPPIAATRSVDTVGTFAFAIGSQVRLEAAVARMVDARDDARKSFASAAEKFIGLLHSESFRESHEAAVHVLGPLQQAVDRLGQVPVLGGAFRGNEVETRRQGGAAVADALEAFDVWIAENTAGTVAKQTEKALAALLSASTAVLAPRAPTPSAPPAVEDAKALAQKSLASLSEAVVAVDGALSTEQRYWELADPLRSLPVGVVRAAAGALLAELTQQIEDVEALYAYGEVVEERRDASLRFMERAPPDVAELVKQSDLARACQEKMDEGLAEMTALRNEPEETRNNRRLQELEADAKTQRRRRYEAEKALKAERRRLCTLAAEHMPELPLRFPEAGIRLDEAEHAATAAAHEMRTRSGRRAEEEPEPSEGGPEEQQSILLDVPSAMDVSAAGLGAMLEAEATDLAKLRDSLATAEERYAQAQQQQPERPAAEQGLEELDPAAQETPEAAALRRQRRELLRRQRAFGLKCQLAGRSAELVPPPHSPAPGSAAGASVSQLADYLGGRAEELPADLGDSSTPAHAGDAGQQGAQRATAAAFTAAARAESGTPGRRRRSARQTQSPPHTLSRPTFSAAPVASPAAPAPRSASAGGATERNSTMTAAAERARLRSPERRSGAQTVIGAPARTPVRTSLLEDPSPTAERPSGKPLTRLEQARQQVSARIAGGDEGHGTLSFRAGGARPRSPSPPRTISARVAERDEPTRRAMQAVAPGDERVWQASMSPPPRESPVRAAGGAADDGRELRRTATARVNASWSASQDQTEALEVSAEAGDILAAIDKNLDGVISRQEYSEYQARERSLEATLAYAEYSGKQATGAAPSWRSASVQGVTQPPGRFPLPVHKPLTCV